MNEYGMFDVVRLSKRIEMNIPVQIPVIKARINKINSFDTQDISYSITYSQNLDSNLVKIRIFKNFGHLRSQHTQAFVSGYLKYDEISESTEVNCRVYPGRTTLAVLIFACIGLLLGPMKLLEDNGSKIISLLILSLFLWYIFSLFRAREAMYQLLIRVLSEKSDEEAVLSK